MKILNSKTHAIIFDMDGVLTNSEPLITAAAIAMFAEIGLNVHSDDFIPFVGTGEDRFIGGVAEKYHFKLNLFAAKQRTYEIYLNLVPSQLESFSGALDLVLACRKSGLKVAVASSGDMIKVETNLKKIGLPIEFWDSVTTGEQVKSKKPSPDIFLTAAESLYENPSACTVVEDAINGIQAAKTAGMRCVAVAHTFPVEKLLKADVVREKISEVLLSDLSP